MSGIKNSDGTVNFEGLQNHITHLKGKYAQNAKNYKENTGKEFSSPFGAQDEGVQGSLAGQSAAPKPDDNEEETPDTRQENMDAPDATEHDERKND